MHQFGIEFHQKFYKNIKKEELTAFNTLSGSRSNVYYDFTFRLFQGDFSLTPKNLMDEGAKEDTEKLKEIYMDMISKMKK